MVDVLMSRAIQTQRGMGGWLLCTVVSTLSLEKSMQWILDRRQKEHDGSYWAGRADVEVTV